MNDQPTLIQLLGSSNFKAREDYLRTLGRHDQRLRDRVVQFIRDYDSLEHLLLSCRLRADRSTEDAMPDATGNMLSTTEGQDRTFEHIESTVGGYRLLEQIGEGGMGRVYVAEQDQPIRRRVALKVIKPGMDTRDVIARFEQERQALALMDHPNIAKALDAGSTKSGLPYFVMELVRGVPITDFCNQSRLTLRARLELFLSVCQAIQHAHQKGIIHRDLKPSNVLVSLHEGTPVVKVIDFGVAKALHQRLTDKTVYTRFSQIVGTPLYMSPEQAEISGIDVDTRADIYSLGVMLYELLTGTTPFEKTRFIEATYDEVRRILRDEEPPKPSVRLNRSTETFPAIAVERNTDAVKLSRQVRGELDWIVMKCLEKDRARRYDSASSLARDLDCHLRGDVVSAGPPSARYRLWKTIRRHRIALTAISTLLLILSMGIIGTTIGLQQARRARDAEASQRKLANATIQKLRKEEKRVLLLLTQLSNVLGSYSRTYAHLLPKVMHFSDNPSDVERYWFQRLTTNWQQEAIDDATLSKELTAMRHSNLGTFWMRLERYDAAEREFQQSANVWKTLATKSQSTRHWDSLISVRREAAQALRRGGKDDDANREWLSNLADLRTLCLRYPLTTESEVDGLEVRYQENLVRCLYRLSTDLSKESGGERNAEAYRREALERHGQLLEHLAAAKNVHLDRIASSVTELAEQQRASIPGMQSNLDLWESRRRKMPANQALSLIVSAWHHQMAEAHVSMQNRSEAIAAYDSERRILETLMSQSPTNSTIAVRMVMNRVEEADARMQWDQLTEAQPIYQQMIELLSTFPQDSSPFDHLRSLVHARFAVFLERNGRWEEAVQSYKTALGFEDREPGSFSPSELQLNYARALEVAGHTDEARDIYEQVIQRCKLARLTADIEINSSADIQAIATIRLAELYLVRSVWDKALRTCDDFLATYTTLESVDGHQARSNWLRIRALRVPPLVSLHRIVEAANESDLVNELTAREDDLQTLKAIDWYNLACAYSRAGAIDESGGEQHFQRAYEMLERAARFGYRDIQQAKNDTDLAPLRDRAEYRKFFDLLDLPTHPSPTNSSPP